MYFFEIGGVFLGHFDVGRTARRGHERLPLGQFLGQLLALVGNGVHRPLSHLDHVGEADRFDRAVELFDGDLVLREDRRRDDGHELLAAADALQHVEDLRNFENGTEGAAVEAFAAVDALALVDVLHAVLVLGDGLHGTRLLARNGDVDDRVVGTTVVADAAAHAKAVVDAGLTGLLVEVDRVLRTVERAGASHAAAAEVRDVVVDPYARRTGLVDHAHDVLLEVPVAFERTARIVRQGCQFVGFVGHVVAQQGQRFVFPDGALLVDAAAPLGLGVARTEFERQAVDLCDQLVLFPEFDEFRQ